MSSNSDLPSETALSNPQQFRTTRWSVVLSALDSDTSGSRVAMEHLCRLYWYPVFHFIRRTGHSQHNAQDLTQSFFARFVEKHWLEKADRSRGRFRSFLLMILKRFLAGEWKKEHAIKRAGNLDWLSLNMETAETRYALEPADTTTPDQSFEKQWALTLLETVMDSLKAQYTEEGKPELFEKLKPCLMGSRESQPYAELGKELNMSLSAVKVAVHRFRKQYRECLRTEISHTVSTPTEVDEEMKHLIRVLARG